MPSPALPPLHGPPGRVSFDRTSPRAYFLRRPSRPLGPSLALVAVSIALGLATRWAPAAFPVPVARFGGDVLWASMVYFVLALVRRTAAPSALGLTAVSIAFAVELSQLYHAPWIDAIRATRVGALALGQGFLWSDLACYVVGVALGAGVDASLLRRRAQS